MLNSYPKISIVTPSYNQAEFLEATIESVLSQGYPNLEYIIIDGGSEDGSVEIIKKYEAYLAYWCSEPDAGQYDAINKGFGQASGDIMAWINSDDMYFPWTFKTVASIMSDLPEVEWLTTLTQGYWDYQGLCQGFLTTSGYSRKAFLNGCNIPWSQKAICNIQQESTFWKRSLWDAVGASIPTQYKLAGDFELWARFFERAELYGVQSPLGGFRFQVNQRSRQKELYTDEVRDILNSMRYRCKWKPSSYRHIPAFLRLQQIPALKKAIVPLFGYLGKKIVREKFDSGDASWQIRAYKFYYL